MIFPQFKVTPPRRKALDYALERLEMLSSEECFELFEETKPNFPRPIIRGRHSSQYQFEGVKPSVLRFIVKLMKDKFDHYSVSAQGSKSIFEFADILELYADDLELFLASNNT